MKINEPWRESIVSISLAPGPENYGEGVLPGLTSQLGIVSVRASVIERYTLVVLDSWNVGADNEMSSDANEAGFDSALIASRDVDHSLSDAPGHTVVRKLSPRLWSFAWLEGTDRLILVEARYREPRNALDDKESALIRLLFLSLAHKDLARKAALASAHLESDALENKVPSLDGPRGENFITMAVLLLLAASVLLGGWLALFALPAANDEWIARQDETVRLQAMVEQTVVQHLSNALATGDYGDLQDELSGFQALGYFPRAMVLNASQRVVATAGVGNEATIGEVAPVALPASVKSILLKRGNEQLGRLICPERTLRAEQMPFSSLSMLALLGALSAIAAIALFLLSLFRR